MARLASSGAGGGLLPAGAFDFLRRRLAELVGLSFIVAGGGLFAALLSYARGDASFDSATGGPTENVLGALGAHAADVLLQAFGLAGAVPALVVLAWGWKFLRKEPVSRIAVRLILAIASLVLLAVALAAVAEPSAWPLMTGLGGLTGDVGLGRLTALARGQGYAGDLVAVAIALVAAVLGLSLLVFAMGLSWTEWRRAAELPGRGLASLGSLGPTVKERFRALFSGSFSMPRRRPGPRLEPTLQGRAAGKQAGRPRPTAPLVAAKPQRPRTGRKAKAQRQRTLDLGPPGAYSPPPLDLLDMPSETGLRAVNDDALQQNARLLEGVLEDFGVRGQITKVRPGPVVTLYELEPAPGTKTSRVIGLSDDIARSMSAVSVRVAVVPGRNVIGIELPNAAREMVQLGELLGSDALERSPGKLKLALGKDIGGAPVVVDLARMPHLLIAGTTGSGKSVAINTMLLSLLYQMPPDRCRFIMIDPKMLELSVYQGIPHLLAPVVTEPTKAVLALKWAVREMEERYRAMSQLGVRNIAGYNARLAEAKKKKEVLTRRVQTGFDEDGKPVFEDQPLPTEPLPFVVVVVDEMADLMIVAGKDIEAAVQRLAQMARAAGIHLIMATQRPSVDVITGTIKANFPTRISFQVTSKVDSRTILGEQGAENLLGQGDMLYMAGGGRIMRVHGPFVSDEEVEGVVDYLRSRGEPTYVEAVTEEPDDQAPGLAGGGPASSGDDLYDEAVALIAREGKASTSFIQRHLQIGYNRAARIIERMEAEGIVSKANRVGRREVLIGDTAP